MIAKPEIYANQQELTGIAEAKTDELQERLGIVQSTKKAIDVAREISEVYQTEVVQKIVESLQEVGKTAAKHYTKELELSIEDKELEDLVNHLIEYQQGTEYYGLTFDQRMEINRRRLDSRIVRSSTLGKDIDRKKLNIARIFLYRIPYGAQTDIDKRVLLSESVRLEHEIAKELARRADVRAVRWTLSDTHDKEDICDELATNISRVVAAYLSAEGLPVKAEGIYFIDDCPLPPHPNCQCTLSFLHHGGFTGTRAGRTVQVIKELLKRVLKRKK